MRAQFTAGHDFGRFTRSRTGRRWDIIFGIVGRMAADLARVFGAVFFGQAILRSVTCRPNAETVRLL